VDGHADIPAFAKLRDLVAHMDKMGFSRPGAKAKMAADPALASFLKKWKRNEADNYHSENVVMLAKFVGASGDVAEANRIMQQHDEMGHLTPELNSKRYALYTALKAKLLAKYPGVTFSRPGAKAKMGADDELRDIIGKAEQILYSPRLLKWEVEEVKELIRRAEASIGATKLPGLSKRLAQVKAKAAQHFSRPGAKAKFMTNAGFAFLQKMLREYASMKGTRWYNEAEEIRDNSTEYTDADVIAAVGNLKIAKSVSSRPGAKGSSKAKA
jgi:hypothetical protein